MKMRAMVITTAAMALLLAASVASAEPCDRCIQVHRDTSAVWYDFDVLWARVDPGTQTPYEAQMVRFAPHVAVNRTFYMGAELDLGRITGSAPTPTAVGRTTSPGTVMDDVQGSLAAAKAVVGAHVFAGLFSGGAELAAGIRHADLETLQGVEIAGVSNGAVVEAHGRLDFWLAPTVTIGALAGVDLLTANNVSFGLVLGLHFGRYDGTR